MALIWFLLGILSILGISRYNESNKLFWSLFIAFVGAFTVASIVIAISDREPEKVNLTQMYPTQSYVSTFNAQTLLADVSHDTTYEPIGSDTASKDYTSEQSKIYTSEVYTLRTYNNLNPLQCLHISTHLDNQELTPQLEFS